MRGSVITLIRFVRRLIRPTSKIKNFPFFSIGLLSCLFRRNNLYELLFRRIRRNNMNKRGLRFFTVSNLRLNSFTDRTRTNSSRTNPSSTMSAYKRGSYRSRYRTSRINSHRRCQRRTRWFPTPRSTQAFHPLTRFYFVNNFSFMRRTRSARTLARFRFQDRFASNFLSTSSFFLSLRVFPRPINRTIFPKLYTNAISMLRGKVQARGVRVVNMRVNKISMYFTIVREEHVMVRDNRFLLISFRLLF